MSTALAIETIPQAPARRRSALDPRYFQIASLTGLLSYALLFLGIPVSFGRIVVILGTALGTQWGLSRIVGIRFDWRSPLISGLSLCLLLRGNELWIPMLGALLAIASKFLIRARGKHVFNPTNVAIAICLLVAPAWVSPGQWGRAAIVAFALACVGTLVVHRSARSDVTWAFLGAYAALLFGRALYLGDPLAIPLHQLQSGALLIFAFFMISDPKTTPDRRLGRILFAAFVATGAFVWQFVLYHDNGLIWALVVGAALVPLIDRFLPGPTYSWPTGPSPKELTR